MPTDANYLAAIIESSDDAIIGKDMTGIVTSWNRAAQDIFGYSAGEMIGRPISTLFSPSRLSEEDLILDKVKHGIRVEHLETVRRHKNGADIPVSVTVSPIRDAHGTIIGASKILRDISARLAAERALALSEAEFRASFEGAAVGKIMAEPNSRHIMRANQAVAHMLGYARPDDLLGFSFTDLIWAEDRAQDEAEYTLLLSGGSDAHVAEKRCTRQDGTALWVRVSATLARVAESPTPIFAVIAIENIDARYKAQAELLETKQNLEQVVIERTNALAQRNLLLREVHHRVKNNLQIVDGMIMMQAQKIEDQQAKHGLLSLRGRIYVLGLVHQQLMGSPDLTTFDIAPFIDELSNNLLEGGADHNVRLSVSAPPLQVGLDFAIPLGLLVTELVTNSQKHAFPGKPGNIWVSLRPEDDGHIALIVADDGQGLASKHNVSNVISGLGSGIVNSLVAQLEGTIVIKHEAGTSTEIRVKMPAHS